MASHVVGSRSGLPYRRRPLDFAWNNKWLWTAVFFVMATILSAAKPVVLHDGGAVTYFSLLFLWLVTFTYGTKHGILVGLVFGFAKFAVTYLTGEYLNYEPRAIVLEYPLACAAVALGGLISPKVDVRKGDKAHRSTDSIRREPVKLRVGYLLGVFAMGVCYVISAVLFYPPDRVGFLPNLLYCIEYDMSYLLIEALLTLLLLCIPQVVDAIYYVKHVATTRRGDPTLDSF